MKQLTRENFTIGFNRGLAIGMGIYAVAMVWVSGFSYARGYYGSFVFIALAGVCAFLHVFGLRKFK